MDKWEYNNNGGNQIFLMRTVKKDKNGLVGENEWDYPNAVFVEKNWIRLGKDRLVRKDGFWTWTWTNFLQIKTNLIDKYGTE